MRPTALPAKWLKASRDVIARLDRGVRKFSTRLSLVAMAGLMLLPVLPARGIAPPPQPRVDARRQPVAEALPPLVIKARRVKITEEKAPAPMEPSGRTSATAGPAAPSDGTQAAATTPATPPKPVDGRGLPLPPTQAPAAPSPDEWPASEIKEAADECARVLAGIDTQTERMPPIRSGACGSPAPISLKTAAQVALTPPATMNCRIAAALAGWMETTLQPAAREAFGQPVTRIVTASSYTCRNRYGRADQQISEHAFANAIDISGFVLADGRTIKVVDGWKSVPDGGVTAKVAAEPVKDAGGRAAPTATAPEANKLAGLKTAGARRREAATAPPSPAPLRAEASFLRNLHAGACKRFGTVLGPDANAAHRDHFHFDLKSRANGALCE